jgi:hypothetical protein
LGGHVFVAQSEQFGHGINALTMFLAKLCPKTRQTDNTWNYEVK